MITTNSDQVIYNSNDRLMTNVLSITVQDLLKSLKDRWDIPKVLNTLKLNGIFVEIGTHSGVFSEYLLNNVTVKPYRFICVDPYKAYDEYEDSINNHNMENVLQEARNRTSKYQDIVYFLRDESVGASRQFNNDSVDFIYIDGNHKYKYVMQDLEYWWPKLKKGGIIVGDDCCDYEDDSLRDQNNDITKVWKRDENGKVISWGKYGVKKASQDFSDKHHINVYYFSNQFIIFK